MCAEWIPDAEKQRPPRSIRGCEYSDSGAIAYLVGIVEDVYQNNTRDNHIDPWQLNRALDRGVYLKIRGQRVLIDEPAAVTATPEAVIVVSLVLRVWGYRVPCSKWHPDREVESAPWPVCRRENTDTASFADEIDVVEHVYHAYARLYVSNPGQP
jgi:hypothetical protein